VFDNGAFQFLQGYFSHGAGDGRTHGNSFVWLVYLTMEGEIVLPENGV